jgi:nicotinamide mononucleotide (NMN) deamidase PncC
MGIAKKNKKTEHFSYLFENNGREFIRQSTTIKALENILKNL